MALKARAADIQRQASGSQDRSRSGVENDSPPLLGNLAGYKSAPCFSLTSRGQISFIKASATPAPGTYSVPSEEKSKFKAPPKFSFGGSSRFGLGQSPAKKQPGPGAYDPRDPVSEVTHRVGFGGGPRGPSFITAQANPGPGAYEQRSSIGQGKMFTARGRHPTSYIRSRSLPGPGSYNPSLGVALAQSPKCGFGTATRADPSATSRSLSMPGPGAYELQNFRGVGMEAPKFSATSRHRLNDLDSYFTPGPGTYNAHATCFMSKADLRCRTR